MYKFPSKINRSRFFSNIVNASPEQMVLVRQHTGLTWFHFHTVGTVYLNSGKSFSGKRKQWRKGQRRRCEGLEGWRKNYSPCTCAGLTGEHWVQKTQQISLKIYTSAKSSRTKKKHRNGFLLLIYSFLEGQRTGACTELTEKSMQPSAQWLRWSSALTQVVFLNNVYVAKETSRVRVGKHKLLQENSFPRINWWWTIQRLSILKIQTPSTYWWIACLTDVSLRTYYLWLTHHYVRAISFIDLRYC